MENRLVHENEKIYYTLCLVVSIFTYIGLILSIIGIVYIIGGVLFTLVLHGISIGHIRNNGVKLTERQFPEINKKAKEIALNMGIRDLPDIYIIQSEGVLNAFATSFLGRNFIVLYSDIVEVTKDGYKDELNFIIAHELAHIKRKHITKQLLILPALWVPFLGNAYSRSCEYTCDRIAAAYINHSQASVNALAILAVGKRLFVDLNIVEYIQTSKAESGFFIWLSQVISTHPPLPKRIAGIEYLNNVLGTYKMTNIG
ncbi:M48 family metallopeptidase [Neobacillus sp. LXY-4]|uniref:M48 family metallopeptidase n=1 Tax=Neobacillus sp. LXY-4 TaxID=3379826 RepID=UPI003EDF407C